jgi:hypothetical protein
MKTKSASCATVLAVFLASLIPALAAEPKQAPQPLVQIAILLDTSGSMSGLIEQAKGQLWKIVNQFIYARQKGLRPDLQVALFEYGKSSLSSDSGWIRLIQPFTNDLDKISEELFALQTDGGEEYCGWVIKNAVEGLAWSPSRDVYKAIFIAGNEPFTQGPVHYADSCKGAIAKGIVVNTIHCGEQAAGINTKWQDGALLADGKYMVIDQNRAVVHFEAPQDKDIAKLGEELNKTYLAFGAAGREGLMRQMVQDANGFALAAQGAAVNRALCKASANYSNGGWDLVDACSDAKFKLAELKKEELPPEMQKMTDPERRAYVAAKAKEREKIQTEINRLNAERIKYVTEKTKQQPGANTLDAVMIATIREQAARNSFRFEE